MVPSKINTHFSTKPELIFEIFGIQPFTQHTVESTQIMMTPGKVKISLMCHFLETKARTCSKSELLGAHQRLNLFISSILTSLAISKRPISQIAYLPISALSHLMETIYTFLADLEAPHPSSNSKRMISALIGMLNSIRCPTSMQSQTS